MTWFLFELVVLTGIGTFFRGPGWSWVCLLYTSIARDPNPLASICGRVCAHPCETACRRGEIDRPISIRALKRFLTEQFGPESKHPIDVNEGRGQKKLPYKVAVVGGGPVGLSASHDLALMGYSVTIFEAAPVAGGMLYLGIPE